jgi:hypothetical protein
MPFRPDSGWYGLYSLPPGSLRSGGRKPLTTVTPRDLAGVVATGPVPITRDGSGYAYAPQQYLSTLYLVDGVR